jgi:hypothetical protein
LLKALEKKKKRAMISVKIELYEDLLYILIGKIIPYKMSFIMQSITAR